MTTKPSEESANFEIASKRVFAAARELVFEAFSNPDHLVLRPSRIVLGKDFMTITATPNPALHVTAT